jgi:hypothetical protein
METILLTLVALVTVALFPAVVGLPNSMQRSSRLVTACVIAAVIAVLWAIYWAALANPHHEKHGILFLVLAVAALIAASFSRPVTA